LALTAIVLGPKYGTMWQASRTRRAQAMKKSYTDKQGQYLAFIYYYGKIHGCAPSESEMQQYFRVSPPSVHQMILTLETHGLIARTPGQARSIRLLIPREEIPDLL
jgi:repressor LexA